MESIKPQNNNKRLIHNYTFVLLNNVPYINYMPILKQKEIELINDDVIDIFYNYALAERDRIEQAHLLLKKAFLTNESGEFIDKDGNVISEDDSKKVLVNPDILVIHL